MRCMIPSCKNSWTRRYAGLSFHNISKNVYILPAVKAPCMTFVFKNIKGVVNHSSSGGISLFKCRHFFSIPVNGFHRTVWQKALNIKDLDMFKSPRICSEHFADQHLVKTSRGVWLTVNAVPEINPNALNRPVITNSTADVDPSSDSHVVADTEVVKIEMDFSEYSVYEPKIDPAQTTECTTSYFGKIEPDFGEPSQDSRRLMPTKSVTAATNTAPDLTNDYISQLEEKIKSQRAVINNKINEINNLKRRLRRRQRQPTIASDLMQILREKHIISESTRRKLSKTGKFDGNLLKKLLRMCAFDKVKNIK